MLKPEGRTDWKWKDVSNTAEGHRDAAGYLPSHGHKFQGGHSLGRKKFKDFSRTFQGP